MECPTCRSNLASNARFCGVCGYRVPMGSGGAAGPPAGGMGGQNYGDFGGGDFGGDFGGGGDFGDYGGGDFGGGRRERPRRESRGPKVHRSGDPDDGLTSMGEAFQRLREKMDRS